jgi:hypothetical protein
MERERERQRVREKKRQREKYLIVLVGLSEGTMGGRRGKEKERGNIETLHLCPEVI